MKKLVIVFLVMIAMLFALASCNEKKDVVPDNTQNNTPSQNEHTHTEEIMPAVPATCTKTGLTEGKKCSVCGEVIVAQNTVKQREHTVVTDPAVEASCTKLGLTEGSHCSICNDIIIRQKIIKALPHTPVTDAAVAATCTKTGLTEGSHCSVCNNTIKEQKTVERLPHAWNAKTDQCDDCSIGLQATFIFKGINNETEYEIYGAGTIENPHLTIPSTYKGKSVTAIASKAFQGCKTIKSVILQNSIKTIGEKAFQYSSLESITIGDNVKVISDYAFNECGSLKNVKLGNRVTSIDFMAFYKCYDLENLTIPDSVTYIDGMAFDHCTSLLKKEGDLYYVDKWVVDSTRHDIPYNANIVIRENTVGIANGGIMDDWRHIKSITIPNSVKYINSSAFLWCENLTNIIFNGTIEEWNNISKERGWDSDIGRCTITCTNGSLII